MQPELFIPPHNTIAPEHIAWFPPSAALSAVIALILLIIGYLALATWRYRQFIQQRQLALAELDACWQARGSLQAANAILKRAVIAYRGAATQSLHNEAWRDFLLAQLPSKHHTRLVPLTEALTAELYRHSIPMTEAHYQALKFWMRHGLAPFSWWRCRGKYEVEHA